MKNIKKIIAVVLSTTMLMAIFGLNASAAVLRKLDLAFVIDTTGSMTDDINEVKNNMKMYLDELTEDGMDFRIAIVDYRDFASRTGDSADYPYMVQCDFTNDYDTIINAINNLEAYGGGDTEETVYSALIDGLNSLSWRSEAGKSAILMGDAPALDPEPVTEYTLEMVTNSLVYGNIAYDEEIKDWRTGKLSLDAILVQAESTRSPITLFSIATNDSAYTVECFKAISESTGGSCYTTDDSSEISGIITEIIETIPDVVETPELSFLEKVKYFFLNIFYMLTFQTDLINWDICF